MVTDAADSMLNKKKIIIISIYYYSFLILVLLSVLFHLPLIFLTYDNHPAVIFYRFLQFHNPMAIQSIYVHVPTKYFFDSSF